MSFNSIKKDDNINEAYQRMTEVKEITGKKSGNVIIFYGNDGAAVAKALGHPQWGGIGVPKEQISELEKKGFKVKY